MIEVHDTEVADLLAFLQGEGVGDVHYLIPDRQIGWTEDRAPVSPLAEIARNRLIRTTVSVYETGRMIRLLSGVN